MSFAVVRGKGRGHLSDCAGAGKEGAGVGVAVGRGSVEARVFFVEEIHVRYGLCNIIQSKMGSEASSIQERFYNRYAFVQAINDSNFGLIKIYRKKELNFDYVMVFEQSYSSLQLAQVKQQIEGIRRSYNLKTDINLLKILNVEQISGSACEPNRLKIFMQYLNFTLRDAINMRKQCRFPFNSDQIMYVVYSAFNSYQFLKNINANHMTLRSDTIFLNPDGIIRFNPLKVDPFPVESTGCQCLPENNQIFFQKSERQFICELKNVVHDMVEICPQDDLSFRKSYELLTNINRSRTIQQLMAFLWVPEVDSLLPGKKAETTEVSSMAEKDSRYGVQFSASNLTFNDSEGKFHLSDLKTAPKTEQFKGNFNSSNPKQYPPRF